MITNTNITVAISLDRADSTSWTLSALLISSARSIDCAYTREVEVTRSPIKNGPGKCPIMNLGINGAKKLDATKPIPTIFHCAGENSGDPIKLNLPSFFKTYSPKSHVFSIGGVCYLSITGAVQRHAYACKY